MPSHCPPKNKNNLNFTLGTIKNTKDTETSKVTQTLKQNKPKKHRSCWVTYRWFCHGGRACSQWCPPVARACQTPHVSHGATCEPVQRQHSDAGYCHKCRILNTTHSELAGALSPVNHKGSQQGWKQTSIHLIAVPHKHHQTAKFCKIHKISLDTRIKQRIHIHTANTTFWRNSPFDSTLPSIDSRFKSFKKKLLKNGQKQNTHKNYKTYNGKYQCNKAPCWTHHQPTIIS